MESGIELPGIGGAHVSGSVLTASVAQRCVSWQISGTDRQVVCQR